MEEGTVDMKSLLALLAVVPLSLGVAACGGSGRGTSSVSQTSANAPVSSTATTTVASNTANRGPAGENDNDDHRRLPTPSDDYNNAVVEHYGHAASAADTRSITTLLRRYYAIARAGDGAQACTMIDPGLAKAAPVDYGQFGPGYLRGSKTCAAVMSRLFKHEHRLISAEIPHLKFMSVRLEGSRGLILLGFGSLPERQITVVREGGVWKLAVLLDGEVV
jgi:hypothetical protein